MLSVIGEKKIYVYWDNNQSDINISKYISFEI